MLFNSLHYLFFFPVVVTLYYLSADRYKWMWLLAVSCYFYMAYIPIYILILLFLICVDFTAAIFIEEHPEHKKFFLWASICSLLIVLFVFKYFNFFNANFSCLAHLIGWNYKQQLLSLILPIGLSFHTFQSLSYVAEVYRGNQKAERHFGIYALYVMFFPQLVAGPIERPQNLLHQFNRKITPDYARITSGLKLMAWGFFKKLVIADRLALLVNLVYNHPSDYQATALIIATVFFSFQIYCDFSGYSDIAVGSARILGFDLMKNFRQPYLSRSITEFWQRWHISLSTWFRDYVYIPLGGNRVSTLRWSVNICVVFLISGFWHGASWTFVIWGGLHGFYFLCTRFYQNVANNFSRRNALQLPDVKKADPIIRRVIDVLITGSLVTFAWIFFRANSLGDAFFIIKRCLFNFKLQIKDLNMGFTSIEFAFSIFLIFFLLLVEKIQTKYQLGVILSNQPFWLRWGVYYGLVLSIVSFGKYLDSPFIYFRF